MSHYAVASAEYASAQGAKSLATGDCRTLGTAIAWITIEGDTISTPRHELNSCGGGTQQALRPCGLPSKPTVGARGIKEHMK